MNRTQAYNVATMLSCNGPDETRRRLKQLDLSSDDTEKLIQRLAVARSQSATHHLSDVELAIVNEYPVN